MERYDKLLRIGEPLYEELVFLESQDNYKPSNTKEFFDWVTPFQREAVACHTGITLILLIYQTEKR